MPNVARWRKLDPEYIRQVVKECKSDRQVAERLGYNKDSGSCKSTLHNMYKELNIDTSHFTGQNWNKGVYNYDLFTDGNHKKNGKTTLKPLIVLRGRKCECCGLTEWMGKEINLEIHHIDGDHSNNELENLQLLCPNCHSYTESWRQKKTVKKEVPEEILVEALKDSKNIRQALIEVGLTPAGGNYARANELIYKYQITHLYK